MAARLPRLLREGSKTDSEQARRFARAGDRCRGADRVETYLDIFCTARRHAAQIHRHQGDQGCGAWSSAFGAEQHRVCALLERRRAVICRDRSAALLTVAYEVLDPLSAREGAPRPARLRRPDRQDAGAPRQRRRRLGALQARSRHRSLLIDEAQDTSQKQWEIVRRLAAEFTAGAGARDVGAHDLRGRRREAVDLFVPERRAEGIRRHAPSFQERARRQPGWNSCSANSSIRSAPARTCSPRSTRCSRRQRVAASVTVRYRRLPAAHRLARCAAEPGRNLGAGTSPTSATRSKAGMRRSTR